MSLDKVKEKLESNMRRIYYGAQPAVYGKKYFYVLGFTKGKGRKVFWGPMSEEDAYAALAELNEGDKFELTTRDPRRAVREVRDLLIKRGEQPDDVLKRLLHKRDEEPKPKGIMSKLFRGRTAVDPLRKVSRATPPPKRIMDRGGSIE